MQKYGVVHPNGFCGSWLVWMMQSHPDFSTRPLTQYAQYSADLKSKYVLSAGLWTPDIEYTQEQISSRDYMPSLESKKTFDIFLQEFNSIGTKLITRLGPNHNPSCIALFLQEYQQLGIKFISLNVSSTMHLYYIQQRINSYFTNRNIHNSISKRLYAVQKFENKANKLNIPYISIDIGKLVFDADIDEYKKLCDYTNTKYHVDIFERFQQEYYNEVWKYIIE